MRSLKTVLATAAEMCEQALAATGKSKSEESEDSICLRALSKSNVPKLTDADLVLFKGILSDLFPERFPKRSDLDGLVSTLRKVCGHLDSARSALPSSSICSWHAALLRLFGRHPQFPGACELACP